MKHNRNCQTIQRTPELQRVIAKCKRDNLRREALTKVTKQTNDFILLLAASLVLSFAAFMGGI